jgi:hypothetical protein
MAQEMADVRRSFQSPSRNDNDAVSWVAETATIETKISRYEGGLLELVQIAEDLLLIQPLGSANLEPDLRHADARSAQRSKLILWNVVVEENHAAVLAGTSLTTPRRVRDSASRTASALMIFRYCLATPSAE